MFSRQNSSNKLRKGLRFGRTFLKAIKELFFEYFTESSIHGLKYICERKRTAVERIIWLFAVIFSLLTCCYFIRNIWEQRLHKPVIVSFNERLTPVWEIPFPTVTICPETKTHIQIFNYTEIFWKIFDNYKNITDDERYYWEAISQVCQGRVYSDGKVLANVSDLIGALSKASPNLDDTIMECYWKSEEFYNCTDIFDTVLTDEGICFQFNSLKTQHHRPELYNTLRELHFLDDVLEKKRKSEWQLERGYYNRTNKHAYPFRVLGTGDTEGLILFLSDKKENEELMCRSAMQGFKVILHTPGEEPTVSSKFMNVPFDQSVLLTIKPRLIETSQGLRNIPPERFEHSLLIEFIQLNVKSSFLRRQCYYQNEVYLRYFTVYTQANCELECLANRSLAMCGCVKFSMPRNSSHPVCGSESLTCLDNVVEYSTTVKFLGEEPPNSNYSCQTHCYPTCMVIEYKPELETQVAFNLSQVLQAFRGTSYYNNTESNRMTQIRIQFKSDSFNSLKRSELYSSTDFIANCGGLLGLFMGFSILSLVEFVYFFTVKLWINIAMRRRAHRGPGNSRQSV